MLFLLYLAAARIWCSCGCCWPPSPFQLHMSSVLFLAGPSGRLQLCWHGQLHQQEGCTEQCCPRLHQLLGAGEWNEEGWNPCFCSKLLFLLTKDYSVIRLPCSQLCFISGVQSGAPVQWLMWGRLGHIQNIMELWNHLGWKRPLRLSGPTECSRMIW